MNVRERLLAIKIADAIEANAEFAMTIGVTTTLKRTGKKSERAPNISQENFFEFTTAQTNSECNNSIEVSQ